MLKVHTGRACPFDAFWTARTAAGDKRELAVLQTLLDEISEGHDLPTNKLTTLASGRGSGKRVHAGEFELRIKKLRVYGFWHGDTVCILCSGEYKKGQGQGVTQTAIITEMRKMIPNLLQPLEAYLSG